MIHHGDCLEVMATMESESVDAIVTDPPYGLGFMGKHWDHGVPNVDFWSQMYRLLKPGGYLLSFGGTRTVHRIMTNIEDAGFEIRDTLMHIYASGFPKSLNVSKQEAFCHCVHRALPEAEHDVRSVQDADLSSSSPTGEGAEVLQPSVPQQRPRVRRTNRADATQAEATLWTGEPGLEGRGDLLQDARELRRGKVRSSSGVGEADGPQGRLPDGAPVGDGRVGRQASRADRGGEPSRPQSGEQRAVELGAVAVQRDAQGGGVWPLCDRCGKPMVPAGLGTALKPAFEPIVMARKPLVGSVAANVTRYGTGAINVDACRIGTTDNLNGGAYAANGTERADGWGMQRTGGAGEYQQPSGRWPANVILTDPIFDGGVDGVVGGGEATRWFNKPRQSFASGWMGALGEKEAGQPTGYSDSGTYSRFFLVPKAGREDREPRLHAHVGADATPATVETLSDQAEHELDSPPSPGRSNHSRLNVHPTVKPTELMRHLVRLVTPPGGTVLDPFLGSGTTAIAAEQEGFAWIGIEKEAEYVAIAEARLNGVQRGLGLDVPAPTRKPPKTHPDLSKHQPKRRAAAENYSGGWTGTEDAA